MANPFEEFITPGEPVPVDTAPAPAPQASLPPPQQWTAPVVSAPLTYYSYGKDVGGTDETQDTWTNRGYGSTGGQNLTEGIVAVNPKAYPLGTIFRDESSGEVYLAGDRHRNPNPGVVDVFVEPGNYLAAKQQSGARGQLAVLGRIPRDQIPKTREGVRDLLSQYGTVPGQLGYGPPIQQVSNSLAEETDAQAAAQLPTDEEEDYIDVPGLPGPGSQPPAPSSNPFAEFVQPPGQTAQAEVPTRQPANPFAEFVQPPQQAAPQPQAPAPAAAGEAPPLAPVTPGAAPDLSTPMMDQDAALQQPTRTPTVPLPLPQVWRAPAQPAAAAPAATPAPTPAGTPIPKAKPLPTGQVNPFAQFVQPPASAEIATTTKAAAEPDMSWWEKTWRAARRGWMAGQTAAEMQKGNPDLERVAELQREIAKIPASKDYLTTWDEKTSAAESWKAFSKDPLGNFSQLIAESLGTQGRTILDTAHAIPERAAQGLGGGAVIGTMAGGPAGGVAGGGIGFAAGLATGFSEATANASYAAEYSSSILESLQAAGVDVKDPEQLRAAFQNPKIKEIRAKAEKAGVPVAVFDGLSAAVGGKIFSEPAKKVGGKVVQWTVEQLGQAGMGMAGETTKQLVTEGKITGPKAIIAEGVAEPVSSIPEVVAGRALTIATGGEEGKKARAEAAKSKKEKARSQAVDALKQAQINAEGLTPEERAEYFGDEEELDAEIEQEKAAAEETTEEAAAPEEGDERFAPQLQYVQQEQSKAAGDVPVQIDVAKFDAAFASKPDEYVGPSGKGGISNRYEQFGEWVQQGRPIEMPVVTLDSHNKPTFINGRHRYAWLRDHDQVTIPVSVPKDQAEAMRQRYGAAPAKQPAAAGVKMSKKLPKVEVHTYDRKSKDFGTVEKVPTPELESDLKEQSRIYNALIDCLTRT